MLAFLDGRCEVYESTRQKFTEKYRLQILNIAASILCVQTPSTADVTLPRAEDLRSIPCVREFLGHSIGSDGPDLLKFDDILALLHKLGADELISSSLAIRKASLLSKIHPLAAPLEKILGLATALFMCSSTAH